ncbi:hypothetical protein PMV_127 [Port-miou virus]|uniref:Uncharacterized protein n=1 Tax=Port-miou virus TaxID=1733873 RepID=A0A0N9PVG2_9VIRU|nr:hypothetical protein PMV_127 [Port-miou virus]
MTKSTFLSMSPSENHLSKSKKNRFLSCETPNILRIDNKLLEKVWYLMSGGDHNELLYYSCVNEDVERFGILTCGKGDSKYLARNDWDTFHLSIEFYRKLFDKGMFSPRKYFETVEGEQPEAEGALNAAFVLSGILEHLKNKK